MNSRKHKFSNRIVNEQKSNIWEEILQLSGKYGALNLALGFPDFAPPKHIRNALENVANQQNHMIHHYTRTLGHPRLVKVLAKIYSRELQQTLDPMKNVVTTIGAYEAMYAAFQALVNPGDEVILLEPCYEPYKVVAGLAGAIVRYVPLIPKEGSNESDDWKFDINNLKAAFNEKTKAIVVNNPMNPLGKVFTREELQEIADLCVQYDVLCFSDEVYEWLIYGKRQHIRMATLNGMAERTITMGSAGKTFSVTGWKIGWAIGPAHLISAMHLFHHLAVRGTPSVLQEALAIAFETEETRIGNPDCYFSLLSKQMEQKRNELSTYLNDAGLVPITPGGGYFIVADISSIDTEDGVNPNIQEAYDSQFVKWAIKEKKLTLIPLSIFYSEEHKHYGDKFVRVCFAKGFPDFAPPKHVVQALEQVASYSDHMIHHYTRASGHLRLCKVLARLYSQLLKRDINPMTDVLTTTGAYDALFTTFQALICPGDEVILIEPCYEPYMELARLAGASVKYVPLIPKQDSRSSDDWVFDLQTLQEAFSAKTKAIVVNTPMNPLGKVFNRDELQAIADLCVEHDSLCFADEVYQWLVYGEKRKHIHIASLDGMAERTINIGSAGKTFSVTGWKTGWAVGPSHLMDALQSFHHLTIRGGSSVLQEAVAIALEKEEQLLGSRECYFYQLSNDMQNRRDRLVKYLQEADLNPVLPGGGYFIVADISKLDSNINKDESAREAFDIKFVKWAIVEKKFTVIPLSIFYSKEHQYLGEKYIRICFAKRLLLLLLLRGEGLLRRGEKGLLLRGEPDL
ncbi:kynurenine--oxoglutarate transaminase 3-like [Crassostrea virginica]